MIYFLSAVFAFLTAWLSCRRLSILGSAFHIPDEPNQRSLHSSSTSQGGGLGILLGAAAGWLALIFAGIPSPAGSLQLIAGLVLVAVASYWDDKHDLSPGLRLIFQFGATALALSGVGIISQIEMTGLGTIALGWLGWPLSILFTIWMMNLYNFMDGMDGFAGGMCAIGFGAFAIAGWVGGAPLFCAFSLVLCTANAGFLLENFPPAKIFMGDVGAIPMGYAVAALTIWGVNSGIFDIWVPLVIFAPFIVDATLTLIRRAWRREKVWQAHSSHYYQRLVKIGWGHKRVVVAEYFLMIICSAAALSLQSIDEISLKLSGLAILGSGWVLLLRYVDRVAPMPPVDE